MDLLQEIKRRLEIEERTPIQLTVSLENMMNEMYFRRKLNTEMVISSCVCLLALHNKMAGGKQQ